MTSLHAVINDLLLERPRSHRNPRVDRIAQGGHRPRRRRSARTSCSKAWSKSPAAPARTCRSSRPPNTSTPSRRTWRPRAPGDAAMEWRIRSIIRWNALAMVVRANRKPGDLGGHIASFASAATLYDVGFNHFWRAPERRPPGRPALHPGPQLARHLRARLPRRPHQRIASSTTSAWKSTAAASAPTRTRG